MQPLVSIIIPVYNGMPYLIGTMESVSSQTFKDIEIIAADDGSTDGSLEYLQSLNDPRLRIIQHHRLGLCENLNQAIQQASASIIARCDQDDLCDPERLRLQYEAMKSHKANVIYSHIIKLGDRKRWSNKDRQLHSEGNIRIVQSSKDGCLLHSTLMVDKDFLISIGGYRAAYYPCDDWDLQLRMQEKTALYLIEKPLIYYRFHDSANTSRVFFEMQHKRRWCEYNAQSRRKGNAEISFETYQQLPVRLQKRINRWRKDYYHYLTRTGGQAWLSGRNISATTRFALALILAPERLLPRLLNAISR